MRFNWQHKQDKKKRERARRRRQPCVYCLKPMVQGVSIDHVIPKWVLRAVPDASFHFGRQNRVMACFGCNQRKGGMPVAVFIRTRMNKKERKAAERYWNEVRVSITGPLPADSPLRAEIMLAFSEPMPSVVTVAPAPVGQDWVRDG